MNADTGWMDELGLCPVCGTQMIDDYVYTGGDEIHVAICDNCGWPPAVPYSVEGWRAEWEGKTGEWDQLRAN